MRGHEFGKDMFQGRLCAHEAWVYKEYEAGEQIVPESLWVYGFLRIGKQPERNEIKFHGLEKKEIADGQAYHFYDHWQRRHGKSPEILPDGYSKSMYDNLG